MAQDDDRLQAGVEVIDRVAQTAENVAAESVAGDANDEQVVRTFAEDQFDWNPGIGAADDCREGPLLRCVGLAGKQAKMYGSSRMIWRSVPAPLLIWSSNIAKRRLPSSRRRRAASAFAGGGGGGTALEW